MKHKRYLKLRRKYKRLGKKLRKYEAKRAQLVEVSVDKLPDEVYQEILKKGLENLMSQPRDEGGRFKEEEENE